MYSYACQRMCPTLRQKSLNPYSGGKCIHIINDNKDIDTENDVSILIQVVNVFL